MHGDWIGIEGTAMNSTSVLITAAAASLLSACAVVNTAASVTGSIISTSVAVTGDVIGAAARTGAAARAATISTTAEVTKDVADVAARAAIAGIDSGDSKSK
jgi:hypothetical protein